MLKETDGNKKLIGLFSKNKIKQFLIFSYIPGLTKRSTRRSLIEASSCTPMARKSKALAGYSP